MAASFRDCYLKISRNGTGRTSLTGGNSGAVDLTGTGIGTAEVVALVELFWTGFLTIPVSRR